MKSFSLLRTNTALTSNVKIITDSNYNLFLESIDSQDELSASRFKKMQFNKNNYYDELIPHFFKDFPVDIAFSISYEEDNNNMSTDFANQYDEMYVAGAKNIVNNKGYEEEYEYFAPLYVFKHSIPKYFIIFRIDEPGLIDLTKDNFREEFLKNFKTVKLVNMTKETPLGEWINNNFTINKSFPNSALDVDFRELEFTRWTGIDYESGGYTNKSFYLDEDLENENTLFDFEKLFTDGYQINKLVYPQILNFTFLFDDTPATPASLRKWSMNRYSGFYLEDIELIDSISPFKMPSLKTITISNGNIISFQIDPFVNGFKTGEDNWVEYLGNFYKVEQFYKKYSRRVSPIRSDNKKKRLTIDEVTEPVNVEYRIISDIDLSGMESYLNQKHYYIDDQNRILKVLDDSPYELTGFSFADVNLIEIDGVFHNLISENGYIKLVTDYAFKYNEDFKFEYYTNNNISGYGKSIDLFITNINSPINFKIYRVKFTDIKDFDTQIIDNEYSKFEYELRNDICRTEESKMYLTDLRNNSNPAIFDDFQFNGETEFVPTSSDYTSNLETFRISDNDLTELWRKNPVHCRWGYQNSLSTNDYPYLLNNNDVHENYNRTVDTRNIIPKRSNRNLDYFYTINSGTTSYLHHSLHIEKNGVNQNPSYAFEVDKYLGMTTYQNGGTYSFDYDFDYFNIFFSPTQSFIDNRILLSKKKYSHFNAGDNAIPNLTVFRGLKFKIFEVDSIVSNNVSIENLNLKSSNKFDDYKFSILLSSNDWEVGDDGELYKPYYWDNIDSITGSGTYSLSTATTSSLNIGDYVELEFPQYQLNTTTMSYIGSLGFQIQNPQGLTYSDPGIFRIKMQWDLVNNFDIDIPYKVGDLIYYEETMYQCLNGITISDPSISPTQSGDFGFFQTLTQFPETNPFYDYTSPLSYVAYNWVYIYQDYYKFGASASGSADFWNPYLPYSTGDQVIYDNRYFQANVNVGTGIRPSSNTKKLQLSTIYWNEISAISLNALPRWERISLWDKNLSSYGAAEYVVFDETLYISTYGPLNDENVPGLDSAWYRMYSFAPDTDFKYSSYHNPFIRIGEYFYYSRYNLGMSATQSGYMTLDSGIKIYINKKHKNVLVNIAINDNTLKSLNDITDPTKNNERDNLYINPNSRITAANFIRQINDLDTIYGFADYVSYIVIDEDGAVNKYKFDSGISDLPYFLLCEEADEFEVKRESLKYTPNTLGKNILKPSRFLENGNIDTLEKINFYNDVPLGVNIENSKDANKVSKNYNNQHGIVTETLFRHSGEYMPVFYDVELFNRSSIYDSGLTSSIVNPLSIRNGNYIFDTSLSLFGVMKQRTISKVNKSDNLLKLRDNDSYDSIYPMLDEFGYMVVDFFIFKSTWDFKYHYNSDSPVISSVVVDTNINRTLYLNTIIKNYNNN